MPTYQYECSSCDHSFEVMQSMSENRLKKCPKCGKLKLNRLIGSGSGIIFKGSGFYETDYKRKAPATDDSKPSDTKVAVSPPTPPSHGCAPSCGCGA